MCVAVPRVTPRSPREASFHITYHTRATRTREEVEPPAEFKGGGPGGRTGRGGQGGRCRRWEGKRKSRATNYFLIHNVSFMLRLGHLR